MLLIGPVSHAVHDGRSGPADKDQSTPSSLRKQSLAGNGKDRKKRRWLIGEGIKDVVTVWYVWC